MNYKKIEKERLRKMVLKYHKKKGKEFPEASEIYEREMRPFSLLEAKIKEYLDNIPEPWTFRVGYLSFARKIFKLLREKEEKKVSAIFPLWEKRGLKRKIMKEIYKKCLNLIKGK